MGLEISFANWSDKNNEARREGNTIAKSDKSYLFFVSRTFAILDKNFNFN